MRHPVKHPIIKYVRPVHSSGWVSYLAFMRLKFRGVMSYKNITEYLLFKKDGDDGGKITYSPKEILEEIDKGNWKFITESVAFDNLNEQGIDNFKAHR